MDEKWRVEAGAEMPGERSYFRLRSVAEGDYLVVSNSHDEAEALLGEVVRDANRGAVAHEEDAAINSAVDSAIETTRHRTPAQSADGFLRDALVMLADRGHAGNPNLADAVRHVGEALTGIAYYMLGVEQRAAEEARYEEAKPV